MADCPGVTHLAAMGDGGLARLRVPGGRITASQARAVADAAERLGSGVVDLTSRANLQIRGLALDAGPALGALLAEAGLFAESPADRRRNILLDPFSGDDSLELRDMRPLGAALERGLADAPWIGVLSPKFSFALDGGGASGVAATPSDVAVVALPEGDVLISAGSAAARLPASEVVTTLLRIAEAAAQAGPDARARDLSKKALSRALGSAATRSAALAPNILNSRYGVVPSVRPGLVSLAVPVPIGRLDGAMLRWLADTAERHGEGRLTLAPWSAVVLPGIAEAAADHLLKRSERRGFTPLAVARRLSVVACAGAPVCARAREPAKALGAALLALAADRPEALPPRRTRVHLSACAKGCAGSAPADLLLLGASEEGGWTVHRDGAPRSPGPAEGGRRSVAADEIFRLLAAG